MMKRNSCVKQLRKASVKVAQERADAMANVPVMTAVRSECTLPNLIAEAEC